MNNCFITTTAMTITEIKCSKRSQTQIIHTVFHLYELLKQLKQISNELNSVLLEWAMKEYSDVDNVLSYTFDGGYIGVFTYNTKNTKYSLSNTLCELYCIDVYSHKYFQNKWK